MARVSVFTPSHRRTHLDECARSMLAQTYEDWEWIVVLNGSNRWTPSVSDPRIKVSVADSSVTGVGAAKRWACSLASGEFLVEYDHDDILASRCLEKVVKAFDSHPDAGFVYSHFAQINEDGSRNDDRFNSVMGWIYDEVEVDGKAYLQCRSMEPLPSNVSYIWFAPNHVRAFRRTAYEAIGGYNPELDILDDQDIMCRLYQHSDFHMIDECLYLQRMHDRNTQRDPKLNARIQAETVALYDANIEANALAWAQRRGLLCLDLGAAHRKPDGYIGVDQHEAQGVDIVCDVTKGIDFPDGSVGVIRAVDFFEHIPDKIALFNELYRLLEHGGILLSNTPSTDGRGAFQDPTHVAFYNENSFWYFTDANYSAFVPEIMCRFHSSRLVTFFPNEWHEQRNISYVNANLVAIKDGPRIAGINSI